MPIDHPVGREPGPLPEDVLLDIADTFGMLSDATRAQIVYLLTKREYSVNELAENVPVSPSAVSHHLARLRAVRLVQTRRDGNQVFYSIDDAHVEALFREALYHLDHVRRNLPDHPREADVAETPISQKESNHD